MFLLVIRTLPKCPEKNESTLTDSIYKNMCTYTCRRATKIHERKSMIEESLNRRSSAKSMSGNSMSEIPWKSFNHKIGRLKKHVLCCEI